MRTGAPLPRAATSPPKHRFFGYFDRTRESEAVGLGELTEDGHCTCSPDRRCILMDTYPHGDHMRRLLYDPVVRRRLEVGRFRSMDPPQDIRCDLHARFDRTSRQVCIDSTHEGSRQVYVLDVGSRAGTV